MPAVVTEIGGENLYSWVFSGYMLASLLTIPIFSKLADLYGKKKFYMLGMGLFSIGTLYGGFSQSMEHLIVARVIQGLGAGMMTPVSLAMISDLFPPEKRGSMIGLFSMVQLLAILFSPLLGTWIAQQLGWNWIFFITFGFLMVAMLLVGLGRQASPATRSGRWTEIDIAGGLLFGIFCVLVVSFSDTVSGQGGMDRTGILLMVGSIVTGLLLAWNESRHRDPVIKISFFQNKILRRSIISSLIAGGIMYGLVTLLPLCAASLSSQGFHISGSRLLTLFMLCTTIGLLAGSRLVARRNPLIPRALWGISVLVAGAMYYAISISNFVLFSIATGLLGFGLGIIMATVLINSQNAVESEDRTVLSGLVQLGRYLGASIGVTVLTGILPEVGQIAGMQQFLGAFGLLVGMYLLGLVNELI
jgi:MFS family permease